MKYTVVWSPRAEQLLAEIWMRATDREAVTAAATAIDHEMEIRPMEMGESREAGRRICFVPPLGAAFAVQSERNQVRVLRVWEIKRRTAPS